jgi:tetratricopeptide (TPR) repeat protein
MEALDELREQLDALRQDTGASDRKIAEAVRTVLQRQDVIEPFNENNEHIDTLYRLTWWMFVRATALDIRQFIYSSMALQVIGADRTLDETLDDLEELENEYALDNPAPPPFEPDEGYREIQESFRQNAEFADDIHQMDLQGLEPLITHAVETLLKHDDTFRELSSSVAEGLMGSFGEMADEGAFDETMHGPGRHVDEDEEGEGHVGHHHDEYEALDSAEAYVDRAAERYENGEVDGAVDDLTEALELGGEDANILHKRGVARAAMNDVDGAMDDWDRAIEMDEAHVGALVDRALALYDADQPEQALEDYDRAAEVEERPEIFANRGVARFEIGDVDGALADFEHALELDDELVAAYLNRAMVRRATGDVDGAVSDYDAAIEYDPHCAEAFAGRGFIHLQREEYDAAVEDLDAAIEEQPYEAEHYYNRGNAYAGLEEFEAAIDSFDEAIEHDPEDAQAYANRGTARIQLEDFKGAIDDWDKAIELDPYAPMPYLKRAAAWNLLDQEDEAIQNLTRALEVAPEDWSHRQRARLMLEELKNP